MVRTFSTIFLFLVMVTGGQHALATSFTTIFGPGGVAGNPPDPSVLNGMDAFTQFNGGEILFFQNGNFYVGGAGPAAGNPLSAQGLANFGGTNQVNNRAFGVAESGNADITFTPGIVEEVIVQVRGTADGFSIGHTAPGTTFPNNTLLVDAAGTLQVFTDLGLQATLPIANADYAPLTLQLGGMLNGSSFTQLTLSNNSGPEEFSAITLGELTVETAAVAVPESSTVLLFGSGMVGLALWRLQARLHT
ncbi:MAG: PEP-CTERM sorting domain-containing protein [Nitrospirota bacterium]|nr:PEP-CTERM sorting domain-containing protein [Nitrospirota bacterium]